MDLLSTEEVVGVVLFDLRVSEAELECFADALSFILKNLNDEELNRVFSDEKTRSYATPQETRSFAEDRYKELMSLIKMYCRDEFLEKRFREWVILDPEENDEV